MATKPPFFKGRFGGNVNMNWRNRRLCPIASNTGERCIFRLKSDFLEKHFMGDFLGSIGVL